MKGRNVEERSALGVWKLALIWLLEVTVWREAVISMARLAPELDGLLSLLDAIIISLIVLFVVLRLFSTIACNIKIYIEMNWRNKTIHTYQCRSFRIRGYIDAAQPVVCPIGSSSRQHLVQRHWHILRDLALSFGRLRRPGAVLDEQPHDP